MGKSKARKAQERAEEREGIAEQQANEFRQQYMDLDITNPYLNQTNFMAGLDNKFAGLGNVYSGLENTMEDLTVNQQQAQFEAQQFGQSQANILGGLRGAAGGSGIAALAQSLSQQGQIQAQRSSASIGQQEAANQMAERQMAGQMQTREASYAGQLNQMRAAEAANLQMSEAQMSQNLQSQEIAGAIRAEDLERARIENLLGMSLSQQAGYQQAAINWQGERGKGWDVAGQFMQGLGEGLGSSASDRKLKKNIKLIGKSPSGIKIYLFEYIDKIFGEGVFQGTMSDEVPLDVVIKHKDGYDMIDYSKIDVEFKKVI
mgnify:CR=1 FL=1